MNPFNFKTPFGFNAARGFVGGVANNGFGFWRPSAGFNAARGFVGGVAAVRG